MSDKREMISFAFPVYNEEHNLGVLYQQVKQACDQSDVDFEMIFVDDGSSDNSINVIKNLRRGDSKVKYISLSRSFGHQSALFAGISKASGVAVITMDADLQHPPALIPKMIDLWRKGAEVVYTTKENSHLPIIKHIIVRFSYWFISKISGLKLSFGQSDFRLLDKKVLKVILEIPEYHKFLRGQVEWVGFRQRGLSYNVGKRHSGEPKYTYGKLISLALNGIFAFSRYPLHLLTLLGIFISVISFIYISIVVVIWLLNKFNVLTNVQLGPGWATIVVAIFLLGSIQLIAIGILGEYIGRVYDQTKGRPVFIVRESSD